MYIYSVCVCVFVCCEFVCLRSFVKACLSSGKTSFTLLISENTSPCNTHIVLADNLNPFIQFSTVVA